MVSLYIVCRELYEPNSRTFLICEQQNPSQLVHQEDKVSRHRGGKQRGQYELSRAITLLSLA
jgi:hypothetical protein